MATEEDESYNQIIPAMNPHWRKPIEGRLPPDSLIQIWARLPIKSLYKFRSVCKLWNALISSDPLLSDLRHRLSHSITFQKPPNLLILLRHLNNEPVKVPDRPIRLSTRPFEEIIREDRDPNTHPIRNGFTPYVDFSLNFVPSNGPIVCVAADQYFYLCNPSTQEFLRVSPGQNGNSKTSNGGFGYLGDVNQYVLVALFGEKCELLDFGPGQAGLGLWREVQQRCPCRVTGFGLMVDQGFYWKVSDGSGFVVCLEVKSEEFKLISPPQGNENEEILYNQLYLVEFKGCLCAVDNFSRPPRMEIWVLNRFEGEFSWVRKYNIFISGMSRDVVYPFCDYERENGGEMMLCNDTRSRLYRYNLKNRSIKQVFRLKNRTGDRLALGNMPNNSNYPVVLTACSEHLSLVSSGADLIAGHEHLLSEILVRLPTKSVVKFKSVSKNWNSLVSPHFSFLHLIHNSNGPIPISGIFLRRRCVPSPYAYQFLSVCDFDVNLTSFSAASSSSIEIPGLVVSVLQSCNGLLLYYSIDASNSKALNLHVYNPTIGQLRTIPSIHNSFVSATLAFKPHSSSNRYKVVSVHTTMSFDHYALKIYSSETGCWKDLDGKRIIVPNDMDLKNAVYWRGSVHWVCRSEGSFSSLYLEVDEERVKRMPSPLIIGSERGHMKCFECKGKLWCLWHEYNGSILEVHMMNSYEEGWFLKFTVNLGVIRKDSCFFNPYYSNFAILSLTNNRKCRGGEERMMVIIHVSGKILGDYLEDGAMMEVCKIPLIDGEDADERQFYSFEAYPYSYSLACV